MATVKVSSKGWVVIPAEIRRRYGIRPGDRMEILDYDGIMLVRAMDDPIKQSYGMLKGGPSLTKALLEERRLESEREERKIKGRTHDPD